MLSRTRRCRTFCIVAALQLRGLHASAGVCAAGGEAAAAAAAAAAAVRSTASSGSQVYESRRAVDEYLLFHYGDKSDIMPYAFGPLDATEFPRRLAEICVESSAAAGKTKLRALDIGCSVGGSAFELARSFDEVVGVDFSQHFIDAANDMKANGTRSYEIMKQGRIFLQRQASVPKGIDRSRVSFHQGDACNLDASLGTFDVILASNLICRLPFPRQFIDKVSSFLRPNGVLVLVSPYSWLDEYTPVKEWFGATSEQGDSFEALQKYISVEKKLPITMERKFDVPFLIREHERKYQYGVSDCTIWRKK